MIYLIQRRKLRKAGPHMNSPVREEWHTLGWFAADNTAHAISKAWVATGDADPVNNLRVAGTSQARSEQ